MLKVGDAAPDFVLKDADGKDVRLSSFSHRPIVLYFYPKDSTPGCTLQAMNFRSEHESIQALGAELVGVSLDNQESHCGFRDKHSLSFTLLSDPGGHVHDLYGAWRTTILGRNALGVKRCTYLIDGDGVIRRVYSRFNVLTHAKKVREDLELLTHA